ncbi:hypothetical protein PHET_12146 [Paragonimus heterotremus]|uniref:Uncharacterized protein n=1 Tax=Paragonimus heterotremus TaxID=100268 RepID=A0A8J4T7V2_9TREM|nr:hypothetical protein PHET_12146 [Paragonimus heterotremus]
MISETDRLFAGSNAREVEGYLERFDIGCGTKSDLVGKKEVAFFLHFIGMESYALVKNLVFSESLINCSFLALKKIDLHQLEPVNFVANEGIMFSVLIWSESQSIRDFVLKL